jgi:phosphatidylserine/phosphatidylglycerophosphate/cardiolipin synthase-like enzyme
MQFAGVDLQLLHDGDIYRRALQPLLERARRSLWIATANVRDVRLEQEGRIQALTSILVDKCRAGVEVRVLHSGGGSAGFRAGLDPASGGEHLVQVRACPRNHNKYLIVDGYEVMLGSANLTGAGMGAKSERRRNFESGILTRDLRLVREVQRSFEQIWRGEHCQTCGAGLRSPECLGGGN